MLDELKRRDDRSMAQSSYKAATKQLPSSYLFTRENASGGSHLMDF